MKKILFSFLALSLLFGVAGGVGATDTDNVYGYAWSDSIGWISFNNTNHAGAVTYGVKIEEDGNLTGYAWSSNVGWINFDATETGKTSANVNLETKAISGWARACSVFSSGCSGALSANTGGWDGWINLGAEGTSPGVWIDDDGNFQGYAWGGGTVIGWISFSGPTLNGDSYGVTTDFPFISEPVISNVIISLSEGEACSQSRIPHRISWTNSADSVDAATYDYEYEIKFIGDGGLELTGSKGSNESITWNYTELNPVCSNKCCDNYQSSIKFGKTYTVSVRGRNVDKSTGRKGPWSESKTSSFTTKNHCYPYVGGIKNEPSIIEVNEVISFEPINAGVHAGSIGYNWVFSGASPANSSLEKPTTTFISAGSKNVKLTVDDGTYSCFVTKSVNAQHPLPDWQETTPFGKVRMFFGSVMSGLFNKIAGF